MHGVSMGGLCSPPSPQRTPSDGPDKEDVPNVKYVHVLDDVMAVRRRGGGQADREG